MFSPNNSGLDFSDSLFWVCYVEFVQCRFSLKDGRKAIFLPKNRIYIRNTINRTYSRHMPLYTQRNRRNKPGHIFDFQSMPICINRYLTLVLKDICRKKANKCI